MGAAVLAAALIVSPAPSHPAVEQAADIPASQEAFASCVSHRESRGSYSARGDESSARGKWQFLDRQWRRGLAYMVADRLRDFGLPAQQARAIRIELQRKPIDKWAPAYQDAAFLAALNAHGPWSGWRHWHLAGSRCNTLVPAGAR